MTRSSLLRSNVFSKPRDEGVNDEKARRCPVSHVRVFAARAGAGQEGHPEKGTDGGAEEAAGTDEGLQRAGGREENGRRRAQEVHERLPEGRKRQKGREDVRPAGPDESLQQAGFR